CRHQQARCSAGTIAKRVTLTKLGLRTSRAAFLCAAMRTVVSAARLNADRAPTHVRFAPKNDIALSPVCANSDRMRCSKSAVIRSPRRRGRAASAALREGCARRALECPVQLFRLNICCLNDRPPFLDLGLVESGEALRGLLLARGDVQAKLTKTSAHARIGECLHRRAVEFDDDVARCTLGRK